MNVFLDADLIAHISRGPCQGKIKRCLEVLHEVEFNVVSSASAHNEMAEAYLQPLLPQPRASIAVSTSSHQLHTGPTWGGGYSPP